MLSFITRMFWSDDEKQADDKQDNDETSMNDADGYVQMPGSSLENNYLDEDRCSYKDCARFLACKDDLRCSFHSVRHRKRKQSEENAYDLAIPSKKQPLMLLKESYEMWLRSKVGANLTDNTINEYTRCIQNFIEFASKHLSDWQGNSFQYCERLFSDHILVHEFLESSRRIKSVELSLFDVITALRSFIEFRKFFLPVKGIITNPFCATELLIENYANELCGKEPGSLEIDDNFLRKQIVTSEDIEKVVDHHLPQFQAIISILERCPDMHHIEDSRDLDFATSFVCLCLFLLTEPNDSQTLSGLKKMWAYSLENSTVTIQGELCNSKYVNSEKFEEVENFLKQVRPRVSSHGDFLVTDEYGKQLCPENITKRIEKLVYEAMRISIDITDVNKKCDSTLQFKHC